MSSKLVDLVRSVTKAFNNLDSPVGLFMSMIIHVIIPWLVKCQSSDEQQTTLFTTAARNYCTACSALTTATWLRFIMIRDPAKTPIARLSELREFNANCIAAETKCVETLESLLGALVQFLDWLASIQTTNDTSVKEYTQKKLEQLKAVAVTKKEWLESNIDLSNALEKFIALIQQSSQEVQDNALALFAAAINAAKGKHLDSLHQNREETNEQIETLSAKIVNEQKTLDELHEACKEYQKVVDSAYTAMNKIPAFYYKTGKARKAREAAGSAHTAMDETPKFCSYDVTNPCSKQKPCCIKKLNAYREMEADAKLVEKKKEQISVATYAMDHAIYQRTKAESTRVTNELLISIAERSFNDAKSALTLFLQNDVSAPQ